ncbi:MAG: HD-GYP domain-containing protein [Candidatus Omnitrophica bacterium]|nr:HD-GYP domain-containing protein [Candidatus Omnitrophota bacterium]
MAVNQPLLKIDFKKELETASKGMIMIHDPKLLIKLIVRMIVRKLRIKHAAMILYESDTDRYVINISRGETGHRIPVGFTKFGKESPIIRLFVEKEFRPLIRGRNAIVLEEINRIIWRENVMDKVSGGEVKELLPRVAEQMDALNATALVPAFYQNQLMALLLLGQKSDESRFEQEELDFFAALASDAAMAIRNAELFNQLSREAKRNRELFIQTIIVLGSTIEAKDKYTHGHTERVTKYALAIARQMVSNGSAEFDNAFFENLYISGLLHDIGKISIPEVILNKTGGLTSEEYDVMKTHPGKGADMIRPLNLPQECVDGIRHHHERFDGKGYPDGLAGGEIPVTAAILAVADSYDAMTSSRPYRKGMDKDTAIKEIEHNADKQFNPIPVRAFLELCQQGRI